MSHRRGTAAVAAASVLLVLALAGCAPDDSAGPAPSPTSSETSSPAESGSPEPSPTSTADATPPIPEDCRAILSASVLEQLEGVPLNDEAFGPSGPQPDGSLICVWGDPGADTTSLVTTISYLSRGPALDLLNELADQEDFTCYTPDQGTRCEKTWQNEQYPVTDGRTLFWRDDVLIDTRYSNLAPSGYTDAIIAALWG
ncbi:hypothetical protein [Microbacterium immunditiarum]|uniref:DUF3558 domain-containing protein n=1 Tax=Microbacterium immunditiarum TaxID=337480 RepID=A0A7Y9GTJ7_9MICO|nr:hypothetical protein [Microbacterium immunditiarum]NYE21350.1 hypothetical protein [Microbacterium immunditiarum]